MKKFLFVVIAICLYMLSCKTEEPIVNNTSYTTTVGELVTDLPRTKSIYSNTFTTDHNTIVKENSESDEHPNFNQTDIKNESQNEVIKNINSDTNQAEIPKKEKKEKGKRKEEKTNSLELDKENTENTDLSKNRENSTHTNKKEQKNIKEMEGIQASDMMPVDESENLTNSSSSGTMKSTVIHLLNTSEFSWEAGIRLTQILDIRNLQEYKTGHIYDAMNMDINNSSFIHLIQNLDKTSPVAVYGKSETDAMKAAKILEKEGFSIIYVLKGGIEEWIRARKELFK